MRVLIRLAVTDENTQMGIYFCAISGVFCLPRATAAH